MRRPSCSRPNRFSSKFLFLLFLLVAFGAGTAWGQGELFFELDPPDPAAGEPFRILIHGSVLAFFPSDDVDDLFASVDGETLTVTQRGGLVGFPTLNAYAATLEIDALPIGSYELVFLTESEGTPPPVTIPSTSGIGTKSLGYVHIREPFTLDGPTVADTTDTLQFTVSRIDICTELGATEIIPNPSGEGGVVRIPWLIGCPILPEPPAPISLTTESFGPLGAGSWDVQIVDPNNHVLKRRQLEILANPVLLQDERFRLGVTWWNNIAADAAFPAAKPTNDSALFAFFQRDNWETMVKVLDGCEINGFYWVFIAANTDQGFDVVIKDVETGAEWTHAHPLGSPAPAITDVEAFACAPRFESVDR